MGTVLIFDADQVARRRTVSAMRYGGFEATSARTFKELCRRLRRSRYTAILIDPGPGEDAPRLVAELRARTDAPIIAVSASEDQPYKVALLDAGADDYVTHPFDPEELLARVRAVARRVQIDDEQPIATPDFTMHLADRRLFRTDDTEVTLSPTEWKLIEVLVQHQGHLVTREDLLASVWGPDAGNKTQYLRVYMASIRRKVEPDPSHPRYFVTAPGLGLRFDPEGGGVSGTELPLTPTG
jgi:two-component system, OmpR family, KDP operon response regulator KdpE